MNRVRYIDKRILCNYDLREEFFEELGVKITDMIPLRKVFVLFTTEGKKILKITDSSKKRVEFIDKSLSYVKKYFPDVLQYTKNKDGEIITLWEGQKFILLEMIDGREATFTNPIEVELCAKSIANMHVASQQLLTQLTEGEIKENTPKNLIQKFKDELVILIEIEKIVNKFKYKNEFDIIFLDIVEKAKTDLKKSLELVSDNKYSNLLLDERKLVLCHNDLAHHNFIIDNDKVSIIDFDYCNVNNRIMDLYNYSVKVLKSVSYNKESFDLIIDSYNAISPLTDIEIDMLRVLMNYPRDIINISIDYYLKQKSWDEEVFISRLKSKIELEEYRKEFLNNL